MLEAAGLTSVEETVYRLLVMTSTASADEIASQTGLALNQVECARGAHRQRAGQPQ